MGPTLRRALLLIALLVAAARAEAERGPYDLEFRRLADGVWLAWRPEPLRSYVEGNVVFVVGDDGVLVVDASGAPRSARQVIARIRAVTDRPVRQVVLTHIHRDHRFGLQEYLREFPGVEVVAHPVVREVIERSGAGFVDATVERLRKLPAELTAEIERLEREGSPGHEAVVAHLARYRDRDLPVMLEEYAGLSNLGPNVTFTERMTFHGGGREIQLHFLGRGDTDHDVVVFLPRERIVCTGDLVVHPFPYGFSKQPDEWLATLRRLRELDFETLVPGHGEVQSGKAYLDSVIALVESVQAQVAAGVAAGLDLEGVRRKVDLSESESSMTGGDPVARYFFHDWFVEPAVAEAWRLRTESSAPAAPATPSP